MEEAHVDLGGALTPFDPGDPEFLADPYPTFAALRAVGPVHPHDLLGMPVAVSHAACSEVLRGRDLGRIWADAEPAADFPAFNLLHRNSLLEREGPTHARLRALVAGAFNRGHTARLQPWVRGLADRLVDELAERIRTDGSADLIAGVAAPLPVEVIAELLGVPEPERSALRGWSNTIVTMYEPDPGRVRRAAAEQAAAEFVEALRELAAHRARHPGDDLVTDLLAADLDPDELVGTAALLLMAGHEATVNVIGNGVLALLRHPDQWQRLRADPGLDATAVEELIRYDPPLQLFERTAVVDTEVAGKPVPAGTKIAALLGAAASDPQVFDRPDELDVGPVAEPAPRLRRGCALLPGCPAGPAGDRCHAGRAAPQAAGDAAGSRAAAPARLRHARAAGAVGDCRPTRTSTSRRRGADGAEQPGEPGTTTAVTAGGDRGEQVQHRVQHHPVGPGLDSGAQRPEQHHDDEQHAGHPQQPPDAAAAGTGAAAGRAAVRARCARSRPAPTRAPTGSARAPASRARSRASTAPARTLGPVRRGLGGPQRPEESSPPDSAVRPAPPCRPRHQRVRRGHRPGRQRAVAAGQQQHVAPHLGARREQRHRRRRPQQRHQRAEQRAGCLQRPARRRRAERAGSLHAPSGKPHRGSTR